MSPQIRPEMWNKLVRDLQHLEANMNMMRTRGTDLDNNPATPQRLRNTMVEYQRMAAVHDQNRPYMERVFSELRAHRAGAHMQPQQPIGQPLAMDRLAVEPWIPHGSPHTHGVNAHMQPQQTQPQYPAAGPWEQRTSEERYAHGMGPQTRPQQTHFQPPLENGFHFQLNPGLSAEQPEETGGQQQPAFRADQALPGQNALGTQQASAGQGIDIFERWTRDSTQSAAVQPSPPGRQPGGVQQELPAEGPAQTGICSMQAAAQDLNWPEIGPEMADLTSPMSDDDFNRLINGLE